MALLTIAIRNAANDRQGDGPVVTAPSWSFTERVNQAGEFSFPMPAVDPRAALISDPNALHYVTAQTKIGSTGRAYAGDGIIKQLSLNSETRMLQVSGPDLVGELMHTSPGRLFLHGAGEDDPMDKADVFPALMAGSLGWDVVDVTGAPAELSKDLEPYQLGDETHLAAINKIAELTGDKWRRITAAEQVALSLGPRHLVWLPTTAAGFDAAASGIRAIDWGDTVALDDNPEVCVIDGGLEVISDLTTRITRIRPRGSGNADAALYLNQTTRFGAPPLTGAETGSVDLTDVSFPGFTFHRDYDDPSKSYIRYDASEPTSADVIEAVETFRDIAPLRRTGAAEIVAADLLFDAALVKLRERIYAQVAYRLRVTKLHGTLKCGETIHVLCRHWTSGYGWIQVNAHLMVLSIQKTWEALGGEPIVRLEVTE